MNDQPPLQPAQFCAYALETIEASEGRRKRRRRDTTPDAIGLELKRALLRRAVDEQPPAEHFEAWLLQQVFSAPAGGPVRAVCTEILAEHQIAGYDQDFVRWLSRGAPSADTHRIPS